MKCITQNFKRITKKTISVVFAFMIIAVAVPFVSVNAATTVTTWDALLTAVSADPTDGTETDIIVGASLTAISECIINGNKNIVIENASGGHYTITRGGEYTGRIFGISVGKLTLKNVTLDGNGTNIIALAHIVYMC